MPEDIQGNLKECKCYRRNEDAAIWKLRNDSSGVSGALCPEYFSATPKHASTSLPNVQTSGKILLRSKGRCRELCVEEIHRKPVKTCYCNLKSTKTKIRSPRTRRKTLPSCTGYSSQVHCRPVDVEEVEREEVPSPTLSCETLRRVREIDYTPRSQFLRSVRSRASLFLRTPTSGDARDNKRSYCEDETNFRPADKLEKSVGTRSPVYSEEEDVDGANEASRFPSRKSLKSALSVKRTIRSRKSVAESKADGEGSRGAIAGRRQRKEDGKKSVGRAARCVTREDIEAGEMQDDRRANARRCVRDDPDRSTDRDVRDVRKFREMNYFDTHGSCRTLLSPGSSDSLEQCLLNERLFPEAVGRARRRDLVLTMPPCATTQRKRVHYFPRFVVPQEKRLCNAKYKKRRCQSCPLTGHAVDLGVLKMQPSIDSLALKYQKQRR